MNNNMSKHYRTVENNENTNNEKNDYLNANMRHSLNLAEEQGYNNRLVGK